MAAAALPAAVAVCALSLLAACTTAGGGAAPGPQPAAAVAPAAPEAGKAPEPAPAPPPPAPLTAAAAQRTLSAAIELLEAGQEEAALVEIDKLLAADPGHRLAQSLARQVREEPTALLGRESFAYRVAPGESLSLIAQRALGDRLLFYALARYNGIRVPRQLAGGQMIRVPGKAMPAAAVPAAERAAPATPVPAATIPMPPVASAPAAPPPDPARAEREKAAAVARHVREARSAFARQDLDAAIAAWTRVLDIDPAHRTAAAERQRAIDLNERAKRLQPAR